MRTSPLPFRRWHRLLVALLLAAVLVKPVLALDCLCTDAPHGAFVASATLHADDGCPGQDCHDGCAHATGVVAPEREVPLVPGRASISVLTALPHPALPLFGVFRPPIAA
ncbi:MAG: hypothetical protein EOP90_02540 [Lysobacteraceae bacterium]|nr:MAG: hypothetical protein EOP90_02540 [Xanthomonadaceae bacterium]